jgi:Zn-dependent M28 family amino/carboxypeptidase
VCGHYDTFWNTPGAYDNGSGTIALVHLVRSLVASPLRRPVRVVLFTAEEWHLAGSREFVSRLTDEERDSIDFVLNLDGLGRGDLLEVFAGPETFERDLLAVVARETGATRAGLRVRSRFPPTCGTDHASFYAAGIPAAHLTFNDLHRLHQPDDTPNEGIARNIVWTVGLVERLIAELGRQDRVPERGMRPAF